MKALTTAGLTKLIQLIKSSFISVDDTVTTTTVTLADVATTGSYNDLTNKPTIPTESTVSGWGFTKNTGTVTSVNNVQPVNGNVTIPDELPSQSGNSGKFLTTNGSAVSWATVDALPSQTSQSGKFLTTNGTTASWATVESGANEDLSNLSDTGEERLHALKSYEDAGELLTDAEGLADVTYYAHSTFDLSKFTVVGSPYITDDGIASGFSSSSVIKKSSLSYTGNIVVEMDYTHKTCVSNYPYVLSSDHAGLKCLFNGSTNKIGINNGTGTLALTNGQTYHLKIETDSSTYSKLYVDNSVVSTLTLNTTQTFTYFGIGNSASSPNATNYLSGSIDLKQFSITVDGVEVFNGNKTGIDTIKPDDYTVVGTPTISADGVASGFDTSNYLQTSTFNFTRPFKIVSPFVITGNSFNNGLWQITGSSGWFNYIHLSSNFIQFIYQLSDSTNGLLTINKPSGWGKNVNFFVELEFTGTKYIITLKDENKNVIDSNEVNSSLSLFNASNSNINVGLDKHSNYYLNGSIDLNSFKIYVDGDLVYQPCLKIPYTLSKTGSKIVDSAYRDRVSDMYEQFGYAPYYTLNEGVNFTVPQGEIYGLPATGTIDKNTGNAKYDWVGTLSQYTTQAVATTHPDWVCYITDDDSSGAYDAYTKAEVNSLVASSISTLVGSIYPVGSIYIGTTSTCPIASLITGSIWQLVATDRVLQGAGTRGSVGTTVNESLPNITGEITIVDRAVGGASTGAFYSTNISSRWANWSEAGSGGALNHILDASRSSSTYQDNAPVQQDAYLVNIWKRTT